MESTCIQNVGNDACTAQRAARSAQHAAPGAHLDPRDARRTTRGGQDPPRPQLTFYPA